MGNSKKWYLTRRILAMMLAVAMTVTMVPQTALAASTDEDADGIVNVVAEENGDVDAPEKDNGEPAAVSAGADKSRDDGMSLDSTAADGTGSDAVNADNAVDNAAADDGSADDADNAADPKAETPTPAPAEKPEYKIVLDSGFVSKAAYTNANPFGDILHYVNLQLNGSDAHSDENAKITLAWKVKDAEGNFAALTGEPKDAGSYQALLTYPKVDGVHDGAELTVDCEITKAPVWITLEGLSYTDGIGKMTVKPNTKRSGIAVPAIDCVEEGIIRDLSLIEKEDLTLTMEIQDALTGTAINNDDVLTKNGDYVCVFTPAYADTLAADKKAGFEKNFELKSFTVDIVMTDLIKTQVIVKLNGETAAAQITKEYSGEAVEIKEGRDYTVKVQYQDTDGSWKDLTGDDVKTAVEWEYYDGCEVDEAGNVTAPKDAGAYEHKVSYAGKDGIYAESEAKIRVAVTKAELTIEPVIAPPNTAPLTGSEGSDVMSKITYKVLDKAGNDVTEKVKEAHIWGTSYDDGTSGDGGVWNAPIYEPLFTLEESTDNGVTWNEQSYYFDLIKGNKYRITYKGKKAVFSENSGPDYVVDDINAAARRNLYGYTVDINGVDPNYHTSTTLAAGKELEVTLPSGTKAVIDVSALKEGKESIEALYDAKDVKQYDGKPLFISRSYYKNKVKLKDTSGKDIRTEQREFTYRWYRFKGRYYIDRVTARIEEKNGTLESADWESASFEGSSPRDAGVYKLEIAYKDLIDSDVDYYADSVTLYFAIDPRQVTIEPKEASYAVLEGRTIGDFFYSEKPEYIVTAKDGKALPEEEIIPFGQIVEERAAAGGAPASKYIHTQDNFSDISFENKDKASYVLQGYELRKRLRYISEEYGGNVFDDYEEDLNYICTAYELEMKGETATRKEIPLNEKTSPIEVTPLGKQKLTISKDPTKKLKVETKTYDAKPLTADDLVPSDMVSVKKEDGADADVKLTYVVYPSDGNADDFIDSNIGLYLEHAVNAGKYNLYVRFDGDKEYAPCGRNEDAVSYADALGVKLGTFEITQREIWLEADLEETYPAGTRVRDILSAVKSRYQVKNCVARDEWAFTEKNENGGLPAWGDDIEEYSGPFFYIPGMMDEEQETLKRNATYTVQYGSEWGVEHCELTYDYSLARNYKIKDVPVATFKVTEGNSGIRSVFWEGADFRWDKKIPVCGIDIRVQNDEKDPLKREVTMTEAIGWSRVRLDDTNKEMEGNLVAFAITPPEEYADEGMIKMPETAMYKNAIEAAGGYLINDSVLWEDPSEEYGYDGYIAVVFDATDKTENTEFKIRWENDYVETYTLNFSEAVKLANLYDAAAPKALSFNAPNTKMAVGQEQQLDVKIVKEQLGDVIYLGYESDKPDILAVNPAGEVTALKVGSASVTVFAQHLVNGKAEPIRDEKGAYAKSAKIQINVTKLDAPKKVKAVAHGSYIRLNYDAPAYGYRREIYIMEKDTAAEKDLKTADNFNTYLKGMKGSQWKKKGFVSSPIYTDATGADITEILEDLKIKKDYTIYIRNVCAVRTLPSSYGKRAVTLEAVNDSAAGVVVNAKTKKAEVNALDLSFRGEGIFVEEGDDYNGAPVFRYTLPKNGTIECMAKGAFSELYDNDETKYNDDVWITLPFGREDKTKYKDVYEEPKLEYKLNGCYDKKTGSYGWGTKNDYASIDKKGRIKITGFPQEKDGVCDTIWVSVSDTSTGRGGCAGLQLVLEEADAVTAAKKSVMLSVGQTQYLGDLLGYGLSGKKLTAYPKREINLVKVRKAIKDQKQEKYFIMDEYGTLTAIQGGGTLKLELTDKNVERKLEREKKAANKATAAVTIKSKDLEAVKRLKVKDVSYNNFGLTFQYTGGADQFLLEVFDAKKLIYSRELTRLIWREDYEDTYYRGVGVEPLLATDKNGRYVKEYNMTPGLPVYEDEYSNPYTLACVKNTYEISAETIRRMGVRLNKDSQYTVSLTPIYGENRAKPAVAKVKTTKTPAYDLFMDKSLENYYDEDSMEWIWGCDRKGGMSITVSESSSRKQLTSSAPSLRVISGNTDTLTANVDYNRGRVNDTLVWSVGDAKVATVKAAAGSYCITLTGMKPGKTTLEVRSKLLGNKVIARYDIEVIAVGNAFDSYYGENEPGDKVFDPDSFSFR